jgi:pentatricopeptide repeat domain-containing protein 1
MYFMRSFGLCSGNLLLALNFLERMEPSGLDPNLKLWTAVLRAATKARALPDAQIALAAFERFQRQHPTLQLDLVACNTVVGLRAKVGDVSGALALLHTMKKSVGQSSGEKAQDAVASRGEAALAAAAPTAPTAVTYNAVMSGMKAAGDWAGIVRLYRGMVYEKGAAAADACVYGMVLLAQCELRRWADALRTHDEMKRAGVPANEVTYGLALGACAGLADARAACALVREMQGAGLAPEVRHYTAAISACRPAGDWRVAKALLEEFKQRVAASARGDDQAGVAAAPSPPLLQGRGDGEAEGEHVGGEVEPEATVTVPGASPSVRGRPQRAAGPNVITYTAAVSTCIRFAELEWATALVREMVSQGVLPNRYTYNCLLRVCAEDAKRRGHLKHTLAVFREMTSPLPSFPGEAATSANGRVAAAPHRGRPALAPDSYTFGALLTACHRTGNATHAAHVFFAAMPRAKVAPLDQHVNAALGACAKASEAGGGDGSRVALRVLQWVDATPGQALTAGSALYAAAALAASCRSASDATAALELLQRQRKVAGGVVFSARLYALLALALARSGCVDLAASLLQEAEENGHRPEESTYVEVVAACERAGQWRKAIAIMEDMRRRNYSFYSNPLLDSLFKRLVRTWSSVTKADYDYEKEGP